MGQPSNIEFGDYQVFDLSFGKYLSNMVSNLIIICVKWNHQNIILKVVAIVIVVAVVVIVEYFIFSDLFCS